MTTSAHVSSPSALGGEPKPLAAVLPALMGKRAELSTLIRQLEDGLLVTQTSEETERAVDAVSRETAAAQIRGARGELAAVDCAIARWNLHVFGRCECGDAISAKRLNAVPWASRCLRCEEDHERTITER